MSKFSLIIKVFLVLISLYLIISLFNFYTFSISCNCPSRQLEQSKTFNKYKLTEEPRTTPALAAKHSVPVIRERNWIISEDNHVFLLGAAGVNISVPLDTFRVYGQWYFYHNITGKDSIHCCFKFGKQEPIQVNVSDYRQGVNDEAKLNAWHVTCDNPKPGQKPTWVSIATATAGYNCKSAKISYIRPHFPQKQRNGSVAITTKTVYGDVNHEMVVSWMEAYKYLGVDKIITYQLEGLNIETSKVLEYYASTGFLDLYKYSLADYDNFPRDIYNKTSQIHTDQHLTIMDAFERNSGYTYYGTIDHDEFLIPAENKTIEHMLTDLFAMQKYQKASSFRFKSEYFFTSGLKFNTREFLKQYNKRSRDGPLWNRVKVLARTSAYLPGPTSVHRVNSKPGFKMLDCPYKIGYVRHYRECFLWGNYECMEDKGKDVIDDSMSKWADRISDRVKYVLKTIVL